MVPATPEGTIQRVSRLFTRDAERRLHPRTKGKLCVNRMVHTSWSIDWHGIFTPENSLLEMVVRGTIMYVVVVGLLRVVMKCLHGSQRHDQCHQAGGLTNGLRAATGEFQRRRGRRRATAGG